MSWRRVSPRAGNELRVCLLGQELPHIHLHLWGRNCHKWYILALGQFIEWVRLPEWPIWSSLSSPPEWGCYASSYLNVRVIRVKYTPGAVLSPVLQYFKSTLKVGIISVPILEKETESQKMWWLVSLNLLLKIITSGSGEPRQLHTGGHALND